MKTDIRHLTREEIEAYDCWAWKLDSDDQLHYRPTEWVEADSASEWDYVPADEMAAIVEDYRDGIFPLMKRESALAEDSNADLEIEDMVI